MQYTPYDGYTTDELVRVVLCKKDPTDLEIALMERIEMLQDDIEELEQYRSGEFEEREIEGVPV